MREVAASKSSSTSAESVCSDLFIYLYIHGVDAARCLRGARKIDARVAPWLPIILSAIIPHRTSCARHADPESERLERGGDQRVIIKCAVQRDAKVL